MEPGQGFSGRGGGGSTVPHLQRTSVISVNQLSQTVQGNPLDPAFQHPRAYTGELIGVEYLYSQTGKALQAIKEEPSEEDQSQKRGPGPRRGIRGRRRRNQSHRPGCEANWEVTYIHIDLIF